MFNKEIVQKFTASQNSALYFSVVGSQNKEYNKKYGHKTRNIIRKHAIIKFFLYFVSPPPNLTHWLFLYFVFPQNLTRWLFLYFVSHQNLTQIIPRPLFKGVHLHQKLFLYISVLHGQKEIGGNNPVSLPGCTIHTSSVFPCFVTFFVKFFFELWPFSPNKSLQIMLALNQWRTVFRSRQSIGGAQHCSQTILCPSNALSTPNDGTPLP